MSNMQIAHKSAIIHIKATTLSPLKRLSKSNFKTLTTIKAIATVMIMYVIYFIIKTFERTKLLINKLNKQAFNIRCK